MRLDENLSRGGKGKMKPKQGERRDEKEHNTEECPTPGPTGLTPADTALIQIQVCEQSLQTPFASEPAFLVAAEGAGGIKFVERVRPNNTRAQLTDNLENLAAFVCPHAGAQAVGSVIGTLKGFLRCAEGHDGEHGSKNLLLGQPMGSCYAG